MALFSGLVLIFYFLLALIYFLVLIARLILFFITIYEQIFAFHTHANILIFLHWHI